MSKRIVYDTANVLDRDFAMPVEEVRSDAAMTTKPASAEQLTVEQCLAELQELCEGNWFELKVCYVQRALWFFIRTHGYRQSEGYQSLSEAMDQVRKWAQGAAGKC